jgi:hypothetical protein
VTDLLYLQTDLVKTVDLDDPVDIPRDIVVGQKRLAWAHQTLQEE